MGSSLTLQTILFCYSLLSGLTACEFIYPNYTTSNRKFVYRFGAFLFSPNGTFKASIYNPGAQQSNYYLCIIHDASNTVTWSANGDAPMSNSDSLRLTSTGLTITDRDGSAKWSTLLLKSSVSALTLTEAGNLVLLDKYNASLWESFHHPTDTIVFGQRLPVGSFLTSVVSSDNFSSGDYRLSVTPSNVLMQWHGKTYWKLTMDTNVYTNSNYPAEFVAMTGTGFYLFGRNGSIVVLQLMLSPSVFRVARLDYSGQFIIKSFSGVEAKQDFIGPANGCQIPFICGSIGLCTGSAASTSPVCSCPSEFHADPQIAGKCVPNDSSFTLPIACNTTNTSVASNSSTMSYLRLGYDMDYFANDYSDPVKNGANLSICQDLCSGDCQCLGIFYKNSSGSCYFLENELGSIMSTGSSDIVQMGYIKVQVESSPKNQDPNNRSRKGEGKFPIIALVFLPFTGFFLLFALGFVWWRRLSLSKAREVKLGQQNSFSSDELDAFSIPGLPLKFDYRELEVATDNFRARIGSGGFGAVYKGILSDNTVVAVKRITNLGLQGKKEFFTEIAVIGNIHHVNLVKLRGFSAQGNQRLLVYEYMDRGSLDRTLFGHGPVLEWQDRFNIALGTARGLAYLHSGCEHKIIHCDIKPENILLHEHFQTKISDFGLSKLLSPEQSSQFTTMRGTRGYLAPEWLTSSAISDKTDVYSFGMLLLEIVSGRKNCFTQTKSPGIDDSSSSGGQSSLSESEVSYFPLYALEMHEQGKYLELADSRLEGRVACEEVEKLVRVALCCVHEDPLWRPNMVTVVGMLEGGIPVGRPRVEALNFLRFYGRRINSEASISSQQHNCEYHGQETASRRSIRSGSHASYISSQQISGPR